MTFQVQVKTSIVISLLIFPPSLHHSSLPTGKAPEPSRKKQHQQQQQSSHQRVGVGKIDLKGAQDQALKAFFNEGGGEGGKEGGNDVASILVRTQGEGGTLRVKYVYLKMGIGTDGKEEGGGRRDGGELDAIVARSGCLSFFNSKRQRLDPNYKDKHLDSSSSSRVHSLPPSLPPQPQDAELDGRHQAGLWLGAH